MRDLTTCCQRPIVVTRSRGHDGYGCAGCGHPVALATVLHDLSTLRTRLAEVEAERDAIEVRFADLVTEVVKLRGAVLDASRICDQPGCMAVVMRGDDGSRYCGSGHGSRWVGAADLATARSEVDRLRAVVEAARRVGQLWSDLDLAGSVDSIEWDRAHVDLYTTVRALDAQEGET